MSNKRRKISGQISKTVIEKYREMVVGHFVFRELEKACKECTKELRQQGNSLENMKPRCGSVEWESMSNEVRVSHLRTYTSLESHDLEENILRNMLKKKNWTVLYKFFHAGYPKATSKKKKLGKITLIQEIVALYFERKGDLVARKLEGENVKELIGDQEYRFLTLCNIQIPIEVTGIILSFFDYDQELLYGYGRICKSFYFAILSSWNAVTVTKKNLYQISLMVLQNVSSITFHVEKTPFLLKEYDYILSNVGNLNRIYLKDMKIEPFFKTLRFFTKKNRQSEVLQNVTELIYQPSEYYNRVRKVDYDSFIKPWKFRLSSVFPCLKKVRAPVKFQILEGLVHLTHLYIDLSVQEEVNEYCTGNGRTIYGVMGVFDLDEKIGKLGSDKRDAGLVKNNIRNLAIKFTLGSFPSEGIPGFLSRGFGNLETLTFVFRDRTGNGRDVPMDIHSFLNPVSETLNELRLERCKNDYILARAVGSEISLPNLKSFRWTEETRRWISYGKESGFDTKHLLYLLSFPKLEDVYISSICLDSFRTFADHDAKHRLDDFLGKVFTKALKMRKFRSSFVFQCMSLDEEVSCVVEVCFDAVDQTPGLSIFCTIRTKGDQFADASEIPNFRVMDYELLHYFWNSFSKTIRSGKDKYGAITSFFDYTNFKRSTKRKGIETDDERGSTEYLEDELTGSELDPIKKKQTIKFESLAVGAKDRDEQMRRFRFSKLFGFFLNREEFKDYGSPKVFFYL